MQPELDVTADVTVQVDAREAEPIVVDVQGRDVVQQYASVSAQFVAAWTLSVTTYVADGPLYTGTLGPDVPADFLSTAVRGTWLLPGRRGRPESAREAYHVTDVVDGAFPTGYERTLRRDELATVRSEYAVQSDESGMALGAIGIRPDPFIAGTVPYMPVEAPGRRIEYFTADGGIEWTLNVTEDVSVSEHEIQPVVFLTGPRNVAMTPGSRFEPLRWNHGVFGPALRSSNSGIVRSGDRLIISPNVYGDVDGHPGSAPASGTITVYRNGEQIAERFWLDGLNPVVPVPADEGEYRVELDATRSGGSPLSTSTQVAWTFASEHTVDEVQVPQHVVRFRPPVDGRNAIRSGDTVTIPVEVESTSLAADDPQTHVEVQVSFDDGQTWQPVNVTRSDRGHAVTVTHPQGAGFVSLRTSATSTDGAAVEQTIIRAYRLSGTGAPRTE